MSFQLDPEDCELESSETMFEGSEISSLVKWLNDLLPHLSLPVETSDKELRACLSDGTVLCSILNKLCPGSIEFEADGSLQSIVSKVESFLAVLDELGLPSFEPSDLEQGSMEPVLQCLRTLRASFDFDIEGKGSQSYANKKWNMTNVESFEEFDNQHGDMFTRGHSIENGEEARRNLSDSRFQDSENIFVMSEPSTAHPGNESHEWCQMAQGYLSEDAIVELMKTKSLSNASFQSLFNIVNGILDESNERKNGDVSHRVAYLLRKVMQVLERRILTEAENLKNQNSVHHMREEKYKSKIRVLETLAVGTAEEIQVVMNQLQEIKTEKFKLEKKKKQDEEDLVTLKKQKDRSDNQVLILKEELENTKKAHENYCMQLEADAKADKVELENKLNELGSLLTDSRLKVKDLETFSESKSSRWKKRERIYQRFIDSQFGALQNLGAILESTKHEILKMKRRYSEELNYLGLKLRTLVDAAQKYHATLVENRILYNEVQDLKGNIRVHCRIRPFFPGQNKKQTTVEYIGDNGDLVITNPLKPGKDTRKLFKFNKVFGPTSSQEDIFIEIQPLIRSVLDGYNVCVFAYGQTGSGKTYTMSGASIASKEDWGVNNRALNDLFEISQNRTNSILYEVGVQMVEIYNEQVRDLLSCDGPQKRLGIWNSTQPNGLAVPDACMYPVKSTADVLELMNIGMLNRAVGATALNERSSRSHSVLTVHVRGMDLETDAVLRGNLHLVDLAGSERVDRSEATGERLKEAQHINKSLSALGDVIFALAQKNQHVPYRNSKLTQVLQSSLGGQAKTLMFVQLNPDVDSYSETISTLKFAERVSGVELGAARSNEEGRYVRELMEQVASLKDTLANKDSEIERLQQFKHYANGTKPGVSSIRYGSSSPRRQSLGTSGRSQRLPERKASASDLDECSEFSEKRSESGSHQSMDDFRSRKGVSFQLNQGGEAAQNHNDDVELLAFGEEDSEERLSDISDSGLSMGTETGSICSVVEYTLFPEVAKSSENREVDVRQGAKAQSNHNGVDYKTAASASMSERSRVPSQLPKPLKKLEQAKLPHGSSNRQSSSKVSSSCNSGVRKNGTGCSSSTKTPKRWQ